MPPNISAPDSNSTENPDTFQPKPGQGPDGQPASTFTGIWRYPTNRDNDLRTAENWMDCKKQDDNIENLWRVHDKLYDLSPFITSHPGGSYWLETSRGTDITETFTVSHAINFKCVERMLENYYVKPATSPRNTPYTLKPDGFYMTLKNRAEPIFKKVGTGSSISIRLMQDTLTATALILALLASLWNSMTLAALSGLFLCFQTIGGHNFLHLRENWRRYYFDLSLNSSYEYRISHAFSHHMFPNTLLDIELSVYPTFQFLPNRPKPWLQKYALYYSHFMYSIAFWIDFLRRFVHILRGNQPLRPENLLPFVELAIFVSVATEPLVGFYVWAVMHTMCSFSMQTIGATASHHHTTCFVDGDEPVPDPDFGIGQLDATKDRAENIFNNIFVTLITFGHHPMHHMFPTVCHSKLPYAKQVFEQTVRDFNLEFPGIPQKELYFTCYESMQRTEPLRREDLVLTRKCKAE